MIALSALVGRPVVDAAGAKLGIVRDLLVRDGKVASLTCHHYRFLRLHKRHIAWERVASIGPREIRLRD